MKQIVIVGGSPAAIKIAEEIRNDDQESVIKVFLWENQLPFSRQDFPQFLAHDLSIDKLYVRPKSFYEQHRIELVFDKKISRVNFKRGQVFFEDKEKIDYDILVISDTGNAKLPDVKGNHRAGVFAVRKLADAGEIFKLLATSETVVVQSQTFAGLRLLASLRKRDKETLLITPESRILSKIVDEESSGILRSFLEEGGVRVLEQSEIAEVLGDTEAKAVRLKSGKVIATQLVLWPDAGADLRLFKETELQITEQIAVNANFQTNISNVFCVDDLCSAVQGPSQIYQDQYPQILDQQGKTVAAAINGRGLIPELPAKSFSLKIKNSSLHLIGDTEVRPGIRTAKEIDPEHKRYKKFFVEHDVVVGAVLVNFESEFEKISRIIRERTPVSQQTDKIWEHLEDGQAVSGDVAKEPACAPTPSSEVVLG